MIFTRLALVALTEEQQTAWIECFRENLGEKEYSWAFDIVQAKNKANGFGKTSKALVNDFIAVFKEHDENVEPVRDDKGQVIHDSSLNHTENVPFGTSAEDYFKAEVLPHVPDAFIDYSVRDEKDGEVGIVGYEMNFNRYFYKYVPPRDLHEIDADLKACEVRIQALLKEVATE